MISNITSAAASTPTIAAGSVSGRRGPERGGADPMQAVADTLGMTTDELRQALEAGSTMNSLAETRGVSHDQLIAAIKQGLPPASDATTTAVSGDIAADEAAESIAAGDMPKRPAGPPPSGARPPMGVNRPDTETADKVADLLGLSSDELFEALSAGTSLSDLVTDAGVTERQLLETMSNGMFFRVAM